MKPILLRASLVIFLSSAIAAVMGCNKPTSGQNTAEYPEGQSGATPKTMTEDTRLDSTKEKRESNEGRK